MKALLALTLAAAMAKGTLPQIELRDQFTRGDHISVEDKDGRRVTGVIGEADKDGFWVERPPRPPYLVRFRDAKFVLDPGTGEQRRGDAMKPFFSFALVTSLLLPALPAHAQSRNLAASQLANWSRIRTIVAGTRIRAVYIGRREDQQYFVSATDETMTVLTPQRLPRAARQTVVALAETQPGMFTATKWMEFSDGRVRVTPDGVFVKRRRVAAIEDIIATVGRGDIAEVSQEVLVRHRPPPRQPFGSPTPEETAGVGAGLAGGFLTYALCKDRCSNWVYAVGFFGPMLATAIIQARHRDRETELVYRAP